MNPTLPDPSHPVPTEEMSGLSVIVPTRGRGHLREIREALAQLPHGNLILVGGGFGPPAQGEIHVEGKFSASAARNAGAAGPGRNILFSSTRTWCPRNGPCSGSGNTWKAGLR